MFHIVCFLVVERLLYHIIYSFYTMIVILAIFEIPIFFLLHKSNHMLRKGPLESARICIQDLETITSMNMHANWLLEPPGPAQRVFFQRLFLHPPTPASKNLAKWKMQCIHWGLSLFHNVRGLPWLDQGPEKQQHGWVQGTIWVPNWSPSSHKCAISSTPWLSTTKSTTL